MVAALSGAVERERGFTLVGLLLVVTIMSLITAAVMSTTAIVTRREAEAALIERGTSYRQALLAYARNTPGGALSTPRDLAELLRDPRYPEPRRYLRELYVDPMTHKNDWVLLLGPDGGIVGLHSASQRRPLKVDRFDPPYQDFAHRTSYSQWVFWGVAPVSMMNGAVMPVTSSPTNGERAGAPTFVN